jgi:hypothetical protein
MNVHPGVITTTNAYKGNSENYFFKLEGVFALWFTDDSHVAVYIY